MVYVKSMMRRAALIALLILLISIPAAAQELQSVVDYPTVAALDAAVIPPRDRVALAERLRDVAASNIARTPVSAPTRQVGDRETFTAVNATTNSSFTVTATLRVVGQHIYLWVADGGTISDANLQALAHDFDTSIYPNVRALWGSEANPGVVVTVTVRAALAPFSFRVASSSSSSTCCAVL